MKHPALAHLAYYWKALLGFISPGAVLIAAAVLETSPGGTAITTAEWVTAVVACVVTSGAVALKGNGDKPVARATYRNSDGSIT